MKETNMSSQELQHFPQISIPGFYSGKTVALTGGTGFVGQLVIEKLLRCCPGVKKIFVLLRKKKNMTAEERIIKFVDLPLFGQLKTLQPNFKNKIVPIHCNLEEDGLGIDERSVEILRNEVNVFIHSAATLRFDEPLKFAFKLNTLAVRMVLNLCRRMHKLEALVHVSTAYSYCNRKVISEEVYQTGWDFDKLHDAMQWMTDEMIEKLTPDILRDRPNTYTLTKAFGEEVVVKEGEGLPICIVRPSIIGASYKEPLPGWCTNLNGVTGVLIAVGKGLIHSLPVASHTNVDIIPADFVANGIIAAGWKTGLTCKKLQMPLCNLSESDDHTLSKIDTVARSLHCIPEADSAAIHKRRKSLPIYQIVVGKNNVNAKRWRDILLRNCFNFPCDSVFQTPSLTLTENKTLHRLQSFVIDYIPAFCVDTFFVIFRQTPKMLRYQKRISEMINVLYFFMSRQWEWQDDSIKKLQKEMPEDDRKKFSIISHTVDWEQYLRNYVIGNKKFLLKESPEGLPTARRKLKQLRLLGYAGQGLVVVVLLRLLVSKSVTARNLWQFFMTMLFRFVKFFRTSSSLTY